MTIALALIAAAAQVTPIVQEVPQDLTVTLVDDLGAPLADIPVGYARARRGPNGDSWTGLGRGRTDALGRLQVPAFPSWPDDAVLDLDLREAGCTGLLYDGGELEWDGRPGALRLVVPRPGYVVGGVIRRSDDDVVWASWDFLDEGYGRQVTIDADGRFQLGPVTPGRHELTFRCRLAEEIVTIDVPPGAESVPVEIDLNAGGWIEGTATDARGAPLAGAQLTLAAPQHFDLEFSMARTMMVSEDGSFLIGPLTPGLQPVQVSGSDTRFPVAYKWVYVPDGGTAPLLLRADEPAAELQGVVTRNGVPAGGADLKLELSGTWHRLSIKTAADGTFAVRAPKRGYYDLKIGGFVVPDLLLGDQPVKVDVEIPGNRLIVRATDIGEPAKPWGVSVVSAKAMTTHLSLKIPGDARASSTASCQIEGLGPGRYTVRASQGAILLEGIRVEVPPSGDVIVDLAAPATGSATFTAVDDAGTKTKNVYPHIVAADGVEFSAPNSLPKGTYFARYATSSEPAMAGFAEFSVVEGKNKQVTIPLDWAATLVVKAPRDGDPVPPFVYLVHESGALVEEAVFRDVCGPGETRFSQLPKGSYVLHARVPGAAPQTVAIDLNPGEQRRVSLSFRTP